MRAAFPPPFTGEVSARQTEGGSHLFRRFRYAAFASRPLRLTGISPARHLPRFAREERNRRGTEGRLNLSRQSVGLFTVVDREDGVQAEWLKIDLPFESAPFDIEASDPRGQRIPGLRISQR